MEWVPLFHITLRRRSCCVCVTGEWGMWISQCHEVRHTAESEILTSSMAPVPTGHSLSVSQSCLSDSWRPWEDQAQGVARVADGKGAESQEFTWRT